MKQLLQNLKNGNTYIEDVSIPRCGRNDVLIKTVRTLVSIGTEKMLIDFGHASYLQKARQQPDKVKMVLDKIRTDGLMPTLEAVFQKLGDPLPLGYCQAGIVLETGAEVTGFKPGDRVISNGQHAEIVCVPKNLVAKIPDNVTMDEAVFTVVSSIALQGVRQLNPRIGETVAVIGLGLIGQITMSLLRANGCDPIGIDIDQYKVDYTTSHGYKAVNSISSNVEKYISSVTGGFGADGVIITAAAKSNAPVEQSVAICRKKGRIVAVGAVSMDIPRPPFYEKELEFFISTSYGPGRYDPQYEDNGIDYPAAYVRWTENRNFIAILDLLNRKVLDFRKLITDRFQFADAPEAYSKIMSSRKSLGVILEYEEKDIDYTDHKIEIRPHAEKISGKPRLGVIGAGNFTKLIMLPNLAKADAELVGIASFKGLNASILAKKYQFGYAATDYDGILKDESIDTVFVMTRHSSHANIVMDALKGGKNVFVEKPLATTMDQLKEVCKLYGELSAKGNAPKLMVGFNRRFSPFVVQMHENIKHRSEPAVINYVVNAGFIPANSWVHDPSVGGGRFIGEGCHFVDTISYLLGSRVTHVSSVGMSGKTTDAVKNDTVITTLTYEDGSIASIHYLANGNKSHMKEQITVYCEGAIQVLNNYKKLDTYGKAKKLSKFSQDKGHAAEISGFVNSIKNGEQGNLIPFESIVNTTLATFAHVMSLKENKCVPVDELMKEF